MTTEEIAQIKDMLEQGFPETWMWDEHGEQIIGYAVRKEVGQTVNGPCDILVLQEATSGELRSVWLMHTVLVNKLHRLSPRAGDLIGIKRLGERVPQQGGRPYMDYNVVSVSAKGNELSWTAPAEIGSGVVDAEVVSEGGQYDPAPGPEPQAPNQGSFGGGRDRGGWDDGSSDPGF